MSRRLALGAFAAWGLLTGLLFLAGDYESIIGWIFFLMFVAYVITVVALIGLAIESKRVAPFLLAIVFAIVVGSFMAIVLAAWAMSEASTG